MRDALGVSQRLCYVSRDVTTGWGHGQCESLLEAEMRLLSLMYCSLGAGNPFLGKSSLCCLLGLRSQSRHKTQFDPYHQPRSAGIKPWVGLLGEETEEHHLVSCNNHGVGLIILLL